jgi:hypothetical protein
MGFFDFYAKQTFELTKPTPEILSKWVDFRNNVDAISVMEVSTNTWRRDKINAMRLNDPANLEIAEEEHWIGDPRVMTCVLCEDFIFFFNQSSVYGSWQKQVLMSLPSYYIKIEFSRLFIIKNTKGEKRGFSL